MDINKTFKLELKLSELLSCLNRGKYSIDKIYPTMNFYFSWGKISVYSSSTTIRVNCARCDHLMVFYIENNFLLNYDYSVVRPGVPYSIYCEDCIDAMNVHDYKILEQESHRILEAYPQ